MKLGSGMPIDKKQIILMIVLITVILGAGGFFVYSNFMGDDDSSDVETMPSAPVQTTPPNQVNQQSSSGTPDSSTAPSTNTSNDTSTPQRKAIATPSISPTSSETSPGTTTISGFLKVNYPSSWKFKNEGNWNIITNGDAEFAMNTQSDNNDSKLIAEWALKEKAKGFKVVDKGKGVVAGQPAYWIAAKSGNKLMRIVGVAGNGNFAIVATTKSKPFSAYRKDFNNIQQSIRITR